jgi:hypothetical protein
MTLSIFAAFAAVSLQQPPPPGTVNTCLEELVYSEAGQYNNQWIPPVTSSSQGFWRWMRYEYTDAIDESVPCPSDEVPCEEVQLKSHIKVERKKETTTTTTTQNNISASLIPLFLFLAGSNLEYKNETKTVMLESMVVACEAGSLGPGQRIIKKWMWSVTRERETRHKDTETKTRGKIVKELTGAVGGYCATPQSYDECYRVWVGNPCTPVQGTPCEVEPGGGI